jgi:glycosyltransferase involved in cell wall biosynthesis
MKITIATGPIFPVPAVRGGAVQRLWEGLAREFAKRGHEVTIFAREFPGQATEETVDGIRYVRRGGYAQSTSINRDLVQCLLYALKAARHVPPGDVVVTNDFWMPAVLPWLRPSVGKVIPCLQRFPKNQGRLYNKCAALAAVSRAVADAVKAQSPAVAGKVVVVPNAIDYAFLKETQSRGDRGQESTEGVCPEAVSPSLGSVGRCFSRAGRDSREEAQEERGIRHTAGGRRAVRILYVGRIHPEKGLGLLANALRLLAEGGRRKADGIRHEAEGERHTADGRRRELPEWECVLVGPVKQSEGGGGEAFGEELKLQVEGLPVRFEAPVYDPAVLAKIYDEADVFVYPSVAETGESFGIAPLEAMARGVVPVVSDLAVFREYLDPGVNGGVFYHRSKDAAENLAMLLQELIEHPDRRERMGTAARQTAECFSPAAIADKYLQLFQKVVSGT